MGIVFGLVYIALLLFFVALIVRLVFDWVQMFARSWRPRGVALVTAHAVYSVTDKPAQTAPAADSAAAARRTLLDLGFLLLFVAVTIAMAVAKPPCAPPADPAAAGRRNGPTPKQLETPV